MKSLQEIIWRNTPEAERARLRMENAAQFLADLDTTRAERGDETIGSGVASNILRRELAYLDRRSE